MSTCKDVRPLLLEAPPQVLAGQGDDAVAVHLRTCAACREAARVILEETEALNAFITAPSSLPDVESILDAALTPTAEPDAATSEPARVIPFPGWRSWAGLAVAAAAAAVVLFRPDAPLPTRAERLALTPPVVESAEQDVAVMETSNPDITVLWFY